MNKNRIYGIALLVFFGISMFGQGKVLLQFDKPLYLTGDRVQFGLFVPDDLLPDSIVLKLSLNLNGQRIDDLGFLKLQGVSHIESSFVLGQKLVSGDYDIVAWSFDLNSSKEIQILTARIAVLSTISDLPVNSKFNVVQNGLPVTNLKLEIDPDELKERVVVNGQLSSLIAGDIESGCISVVDNNLYSNGSGNLIQIKEINVGVIESYSFIQSPYISGNIYKDQTNDPLEVIVLGAYRANDGKMFYTKSDETGAFFLPLDDYQGPYELQFIPYLFNEQKALDVALSKSVITHQSSGVTEPLSEPKIVEANLKNARKISNYFMPAKNEKFRRPKKKKPSEIDGPNFIHEIFEKKEFAILGPYLDDMGVFKVKMIKNKSGYFARIYNPNINKSGYYRYDPKVTNFYRVAPIFVIDGIMTKDADLVYNISIDLVERISVYFEDKLIKRKFGSFGNFGYVFIDTKLKNANSMLTAGDGLITVDGIMSPNDVSYNITSQESRRSEPLIRPTLFWSCFDSPDLENNSKFKFIQSDDHSSYTIRALGINSNGAILYGQHTYKVHPSDN